MSTERVVTDNELIAEFMGEEISAVIANYGQPIQVLVLPRKPISETKTGRPIEAKYETSWDWLMPVVEKINAIEDCFVMIKETNRDNYGWYTSLEYAPIVGSGSWKYFYYKGYDRLTEEIERSTKEAAKYGELYESDTRIIVESKTAATYKAVVGFIKWYNSQENSPENGVRKT